MSRNEQETPESDSQENYEAAVLDFLDREMAAVQPTQNRNEQSEELDALVSDLLKQVITESDQPAKEQNAASDGLEDVLSEFPPEEVEAFPSVKKDPESPAVSMSTPMDAKEEPEGETPQIQSSAILKAPAFAPVMASKSKIPFIAVAGVCLLIVIAAAIYYSSSAPKDAAKNGERQTVASAPVLPAIPNQDQPTPAPPATNAAAQQKGSPKSDKSIRLTSVSDPDSAIPVQNAEASREAATPQPSNQTIAPAKTAPEPAIEASSRPLNPPPDTEMNPATAKPPAAPIQVTDTSVRVADTPAISPVAETTTPAISAPGNKPAPLPISVPLSVEKPATTSQSAASALAVSRTVMPAIPISQTSPVYPELALRSHASGSVVLDLQIDREGKVVKATPVSGPAVFYNAAVKAVMQWRYRPASVGGTNVTSQSRATLVFNLNP